MEFQSKVRPVLWRPMTTSHCSRSVLVKENAMSNGTPLWTR